MWVISMPKWTNEQSLAINSKGQNIIVSAGAGSGKTAVLSERVLTHIKNGIDVDSMLILTFTNAAAAEMKDRIKKKIMAYEEFAEQALKVDSADITTFDAYALSLVKKYNHLLNISDKVNIIDSVLISLKKREFLEEIFEFYYKEENTLFLKLIDNFCLKDDKDIFESILKINDSLDNLYDKESYLKNYLDSYYSDFNINKFTKEYFSLIKKKIGEIKIRINYLSSYVTYDYIEKINESLSLLFSASCYDEVKKSLPERIPNLPRGMEEEAKEIKSAITSLIKEIRVLTVYENEDVIKASILNTYDYASIIVDIILKLASKVTTFKCENNAYEFIDISKMAIKILEDNDKVRKELKYRYKEILIDEYQDTNDLQELFISLIENKNVYMVGDIKQSIYRFRNANPLLFKNKYDNYSNALGGMKIDLNKNFRSREDVCKNINLIFNLVMDDSIGGANYFDSHQMVYGNKAYDKIKSENYNMEILNYSSESDFSREEIEIFTIARDIKEKISSEFKIMDKDSLEMRKVNYSDFVILIDRSSSFELYKKIFEYLNIPLSIYRDKTISDSTDIMLIRNLYHIVFSIKDNSFDTLFKHAFMSILRSYLYRLSDEEIFNIIAFNKFHDTDLYKKCNEIANLANELNNEEFYLKLIDEFDFYSKIITDGDVKEHIIILDSILKTVSDLNTIGYSPRKFLDYLDETLDRGLDIKLSINKENSNSVKIMTIHGSKGLEFPICYFSSLYKKFNIDELKNKFYFSLDYGIIIPYFDKGPRNTILKILLKDKYKHEEISERLRLFYVALTRAREKIIMVTELKQSLIFKDNGVIDDGCRGKYMSFNDILSSIYEYISSYVRDISLDDLKLTKDYNFSKKIQDFKNKINKKLKVREYSACRDKVKDVKFSKSMNKLINFKEKENIDLGLRMHKVFEYIDFKKPDYSSLSSYEKDLVYNFLNLNIIKKAKEIYKEYEFIYEDDGKEMHGIIDLLILDDSGYSIVDYKLNDVTDEAYLNQLYGYQKYIKSLTDKNVDIYLYSIMQGKLVKLD